MLRRFFRSGGLRPSPGKRSFARAEHDSGRRRKSRRLRCQSAQGWERTSWLGRDLEIRIIVLLVARRKHGRPQRARVWHGGPSSACCAKSGQRRVSRQTSRRKERGSARRHGVFKAPTSRVSALRGRDAGARAADGEPTGGYAPVPRATHPAAPSRFPAAAAPRPLCTSLRGCRRPRPGSAFASLLTCRYRFHTSFLLRRSVL